MAWREKIAWLKPNVRKVILLIGFSLFFPSPIFLIVVVAFAPAVFTMFITLAIIEGMEAGSWQILGFLIGFSYFAILVFLNYLIVCWLEKVINKKNLALGNHGLDNCVNEFI